MDHSAHRHTSEAFDVTAYLNRDEGQHFDRKSLFVGEPGAKRPRDRRTVRDQIAKYVAAFANAEGGVLLLGIEDDGQVTGHRYPANVVDAMLKAPTLRLSPSQPAGFRIDVDGTEVLAFRVPMAPVPVHLEGDGYPLRMGDETVQARVEHIERLKLTGLLESAETRSVRLGVDALDPEMLARAQAGAGLAAVQPSQYLIDRRLADWRGSRLELRQAAELLFRKGLPDHPNAGIRIFRVVGTERRTGLEHNVEELPRVEGALPRVLDETYAIISRVLRRPSRLTAGGRFRQTSEYPEFSWKEAILNAVAHRDYAVHGRGVEVWLFDDRLEVTSPGTLLPDVKLADLLEMKRVHISRNPRLVRSLVDLGFMRDQGEGIPRMFWEMQSEFLPPPEVEVSASMVRLTLRNMMTISEEDREFIESLGMHELSAHEFKALLEAHQRGRIDNARLRAIAGLDTLRASKLLGALRDRNLLEQHAAGSASYYTLHSVADASATLLEPQSQDLDAQSQNLDVQSQDLDVQSQDLDVQSQDLDVQSQNLEAHKPTLAESPERTLDAAHAVPETLVAEIQALGKRPGVRKLRGLIERLCQTAPRDTATLAAILQRNPEALARHLRAMLKNGRLRFRFPENPTHPAQAYVAVQPRLLEDGEG